MDNPQAVKLAQQLVSRKFPNEEGVRLRLVTVLEALDYDVEPEYGVQSGGWMDIYLPQRRVVIETKRTGEADPDSVRNTDTGETQFEQCERYVQAEWERDRARLDFDGLGDLPWRAINPVVDKPQLMQ